MSKFTKTNDEAVVRTYIDKAMIERFGSYSAYARKKQVNPSYISNVLRGLKPIPDWMLKSFKIEREVVETYRAVG